MIGVLLICTAIAVCWFVFRKKEQNDVQRSEPPRNVPVHRPAPQTIYEAVTQFASVCKMCKDQTGWAFDERDSAHIRVSGDEQQVQLQCTCYGECVSIHLNHVCKDTSFCKEGDNCISYTASFPISVNTISIPALVSAFTKGHPNASYKPQTLKPDGYIWVFFNIS